jgi:hypothetical protein
MSHLRLVEPPEYKSELPPVKPQPGYTLSKIGAILYMLALLFWMLWVVAIILRWMAGS